MCAWILKLYKLFEDDHKSIINIFQFVSKLLSSCIMSGNKWVKSLLLTRHYFVSYVHQFYLNRVLTQSTTLNTNTSWLLADLTDEPYWTFKQIWSCETKVVWMPSSFKSHTYQNIGHYKILEVRLFLPYYNNSWNSIY